MKIPDSLREMIKVHGWLGTAATLGTSKAALEARVYELKGSRGLHVGMAMLLQAYSGTTLFAEAIAHESGGVFVKLPEVGDLDGEALDAKFHDLYAELGDLSKTYREAIKNNEIDAKERAALEGISRQLHMTMCKLMGVMFKVYCK